MLSPSRILDFLPRIILLLTIIFDAYIFTRPSKKKRQWDWTGVLVSAGFLIWYVFFVNAGISATIVLLEREIGKLSSQILPIIILPMGYLLTKKVYFLKEKRSENQRSYSIFLNYFVFSTGAVIILIATFFAIALLHQKF